MRGFVKISHKVNLRFAPRHARRAVVGNRPYGIANPIYFARNCGSRGFVKSLYKVNQRPHVRFIPCPTRSLPPSFALRQNPPADGGRSPFVASRHFPHTVRESALVRGRKRGCASNLYCGKSAGGCGQPPLRDCESNLLCGKLRFERIEEDFTQSKPTIRRVNATDLLPPCGRREKAGGVPRLPYRLFIGKSTSESGAKLSAAVGIPFFRNSANGFRAFCVSSMGKQSRRIRTRFLGRRIFRCVIFRFHAAQNAVNPNGLTSILTKQNRKSNPKNRVRICRFCLCESNLPCADFAGAS